MSVRFCLSYDHLKFKIVNRSTENAWLTWDLFPPLNNSVIMCIFVFVSSMKVCSRMRISLKVTKHLNMSSGFFMFL